MAWENDLSPCSSICTVHTTLVLELRFLVASEARMAGSFWKQTALWEWHWASISGFPFGGRRVWVNRRRVNSTSTAVSRLPFLGFFFFLHPFFFLLSPFHSSFLPLFPPSSPLPSSLSPVSTTAWLFDQVTSVRPHAQTWSASNPVFSFISSIIFTP